MLTERTTCTIAEFARIVGTAYGTASKYILKGFSDATIDGKPSIEFACQLAARPCNNFERTNQLIMRAAVNPSDLSGSLYQESTEALEHAAKIGPNAVARLQAELNEWDRIATEKGYDLAKRQGLFYSAYWEITDEDRDRLEAEQGLLITTVGGYVKEVARVVAAIKNDSFKNRKVFLVQPLSEAEAAPYMIRVKKRGQQKPNMFNA